MQKTGLTETMCIVILQACFAYALHSREIHVGHARTHIQECAKLFITSLIDHMEEASSSSIKQICHTLVDASSRSFMQESNASK